MDHDAPGLAIVTRGNGPWNARFQLPGALICPFEIVTRCHECAPMRGTNRQRSALRGQYVGDLPAWKSVVLSEFYRARRAIQIEDGFTTTPDHVGVGGPMIIRIDHYAEPVKPENRRHDFIVLVFLSAWVLPPLGPITIPSDKALLSPLIKLSIET
jgi:hypothetical protein